MKAHDLLRLVAHAPAFSSGPAWVTISLQQAPFVVMRRAAPVSDLLAVGVRGETRNQRFAAWLDARYVAEVITPESLCDHHPASTRMTLPAFAVLEQVRAVCEASGCLWGPTGSVGFELASARPTVTETSDLDLLLRAPKRLARTAANALLDSLDHAARSCRTRVDMQVETPNGAFSLAEYAQAPDEASGRVMLRSPDGPRLVADPWAVSEII